MGMNIARYDLVSIRLVVLCADTGSLSAASKKAHCSISAGSQRLSALEHTVGTALFVRDHRGMHLTATGQLFVQHARIILDTLEELNRQVAQVDDGDAQEPAVAPFHWPSATRLGERGAALARHA